MAEQLEPQHKLRRLVNAVNLSTLAGLLLAKSEGARLEKGPDGLVLARGATGSFPRGRAYTVGNVVIIRTGEPTAELLTHEARHATQWAWCVLFFLPLYLLAVAWSYAVCGDHWSRNVFERRAGLADGGYAENPTRRARRRQAL
jgi:hypothetical protein